MKRKLFSGEVVRRLREQAGLTQQQLAQRIGLSTSYVNQIEKNQRPLSATVLMGLSGVFRVDVSTFSGDEQDRLLADIRDVFADATLGMITISPPEIKAATQIAPNVARAVIRLHSELRALSEKSQALDDALVASDGPVRVDRANFPYDEVRDYFHRIGNYVNELDRRAEDIAHKLGHGIEQRTQALIDRLTASHGLQVKFNQDPANSQPLRALDRKSKQLHINGLAERASQVFALGQQIASLECGDIINQKIADAGFRSADAGEVCRLALENYFAGALVLPYTEFLETALNTRHDIGLLAATFGASAEQVCHRLSTMQRPGWTGVPFYFLRVDRAGNITKRHSATRFQFARYGGACPLWNVHEAFETPDRMLTQIAEMPDGTRYLSLAFCITKRSAPYSSTRRRYALGLGCELSYAHQVVYSDDLDLKTDRNVTRIGVNCRLCERPDCSQRAFPPVARNISVNPDVRWDVPYRIQ